VHPGCLIGSPFIDMLLLTVVATSRDGGVSYLNVDGAGVIYVNYDVNEQLLLGDNCTMIDEAKSA
jgi:hypothetical protein